jgi:hypothetical protein
VLRGPWYFSSDGSGRFDLAAGSGRGTCYVARDPVGCFLEVFRFANPIPEIEIEARRISQLELPEMRLADCTSSLARGFGLTAEIHSSPDYAMTQAWAAAFAAAGFEGIQYLLRHDPGQSHLGVAFFGPAGPQALPVAATDPIGPEVVAEARRKFGLQVISRFLSLT